MTKQDVLIIEDDRDTAQYYRHMMEMLGYEVETVLSAKAALTRLAGSIPGLILLDMRLGSEIGGEEILYQIRSNPRLDKTRVIVVTAYPLMTQMISNLADLILIKPIDIDEFKDLIGRITSPEYATKRLSFRDPVTELFNREFFYARLEHAYERVRRRPGFLYGVIVFSMVSEGADAEQSIANQLLKEVAGRLRRTLRPTDTLTRLSSWKFAVLLEEIRDQSDLPIVVERLRNSLTDPYQIGDVAYQLNVNFSDAAFQAPMNNPRELLDRAEASLG